MRFRSHQTGEFNVLASAGAGARAFTRRFVRRNTAIATSVVIGVIIYGVWSKWSAPPIVIPVPTNLDNLDPQLRAYVSENVNWVRQASRDAQRHATLGMVYAANELW